ncbi:pilus assembly protein CpaD [Sphingomonas sp. CGMCC 1.13654]|uniref:Pilus assembly protein CpaD n=1 Tax=Sphingomonas chungangi TaxID=2683589 RepID=A0A838L6E3_9SPHN|nr:CpaD family pilus assembly lipoprotein [Sphingomonas chungangi]MBA2935053.1 pilus assembly protein CpaD [Sphingomonas chungangi]MVW54169.1 pilus assembly protein CpaD [Sphingomonas chungangi]
MAHSISKLRAATAAVALLVGAGAAHAEGPVNRSVDSVHQPIVNRTDYVLDVAATPSGLAPGEIDRLAGWFDGLGLGYGDTITLDDPSGWRGGAAQDTVGGVVARYGMLVSHEGAPVTVGHPAPGTIRVVVSRAVAHVEGCPDYRRGNFADVAGSTASNYGCATATNLAAMIANPQDLVEGHSYDRAADANLSVKAIKAYRDAATTGAGGLKEVSSKSSGGN